jgi:hypothetical protein
MRFQHNDTQGHASYENECRNLQLHLLMKVQSLEMNIIQENHQDTIMMYLLMFDYLNQVSQSLEAFKFTAKLFDEWDELHASLTDTTNQTVPTLKSLQEQMVRLQLITMFLVGWVGPQKDLLQTVSQFQDFPKFMELLSSFPYNETKSLLKAITDADLDCSYSIWNVAKYRCITRAYRLVSTFSTDSIDQDGYAVP